MCMRYLHLAILAITAASALSQSAPESADMARKLADFDWGLEKEEGYPIIDFNQVGDNSEVIFKFNFAGTVSPTKFLASEIRRSDCTTEGDGALEAIGSISLNTLQVDIDIQEELITQSTYYQDLNGTAAIITFCLRIDYNAILDGDTESFNFYETNVTVTVDLVANFTLTQIVADRTAADNDESDATLDYPVEAYFCLDDNSEVLDPEALTQGSVLQVCIRIEDSVGVTDNILVEDILTFVISQPGAEVSNSVAINNAVADPLTEKFCRESGICNVKSQLLAKYFADLNPPDLRVDGVAVLAFGKASLMPSSAPTQSRRRLRVPIQGLLTGDDVKAFMAAQQQRQQDSNEATTISVAHDASQRMLQAGAAESDFGLQVGLQGITGGSSRQDSSSSGGSAILVAVIVLIMLAAGCALVFFFMTKGKARKEEMNDDKHHHHHHSSAASVGTYPTHFSVDSSYADQYATCRRSTTSDPQID
jgi:hypothetical protein